MSTSWMNAGVGDVVAVAKLASILYKKCYADIRGAPEEFQALVQELRILKLALKNLRDDIGIIERLESDRRKETLARCYKACAKDLQRLNEIVEAYYQVVDEDHLNFWKRFGFGRKRNEISVLRHRLRGHQIIITSCLGSIQNQLLDRIAQGLLPALEQGELVVQPTRNDSVAESRVPTSAGSTLVNGVETEDFAQVDSSSKDRRGTVDTSPTHRGKAQARQDKPLPPPSPFRKQSIFSSYSPSVGMSERSKSFTSSEAQKPVKQPEFDPADYGAPVDSDDEDGKTGDAEDAEDAEDDGLDIATEIDEVSQMLFTFRRKEKASQPLSFPNRQRIISPPDEVKSKFQQLAEEALTNCELSTIGWLRLATWWFLKSRCIGQASDTNRSASSYGGSSSQQDSIRPTLQVYINLLKAAWILFDVVLSEPYEYLLTFRENWELFNHLSDGLAHEFRLFRQDCSFSSDDMMANADALNIFEPMSTAELREISSVEDLGRWITVHKGDAGNKDERVIFRTFVDAAIGRGGRTVYDKGAPYLLLVSSHEGESEPQVTIFNQLGMWSLSRGLTPEDVGRFCFENSPIPNDEHFGYVHLQFEDEEISIQFLSDLDRNAFIHKPKRYFEAVKLRRPRKTQITTEIEIFRSSLASVRELHPSSMEILEGREYQSCDLRVLEQRENVVWRSTRRLVLSSSVSTTKMWCTEYFLPMDRVQVKPTDAQTLAVKWSDCSHEDYETTDGNYHKLFTHFYDASQPNNAFEFTFADEKKAAEFQTAIFTLRRQSLFEWHNQGSDLETLGGAVYEIQDSDPHPLKYRAIAVKRQLLDWTYSRIVYCYRNFDFCFNSRASTVLFPSTHYSHYVSNHVRMNYEPEDPPGFSSCRKAYTELTVEFSSQHDAQEFLSSLSPFKLLYATWVPYTSTKPLRRIGPAKRSNEGSAELQVWKLRDRIRVASRWGHVSEKWLTFPVEANEVARHGEQVWIERKSYRQGMDLNMTDIEAYGQKSQNRQGRLAFGFDSSPEAEDFHLALGFATNSNMNANARMNGRLSSGVGSLSLGTDSMAEVSLA